MYKYKTSGKSHPAKDTAWRWFSLYIRLRDCLSTTGSPEACRCVTCGAVVASSQIDAGHAIPGRHNAVLYDESLVYGQCRKCNQNGDGQTEAFRNFLIAKHGEAWYDFKEQGSHKPVQIDDDGYRLIGDHYRELYNKMKENA